MKKMKIKDIQRTETKSERIQIRTTPTYFKWMKKHKVSPNKLFHEAVKELMEKTK